MFKSLLQSWGFPSSAIVVNININWTCYFQLFSNGTIHFGQNPKLNQVSVNLFRDAADKVIERKGKFEELVVASHEIAASTAQLVRRVSVWYELFHFD